MKKWMLVLCLLVSTVTTVYGAKKNHEYQTGKLVDISTEQHFVEGTSHKRAIFTVQVGEIVYTARGGHVTRHSGDIGKGLVVGDPVKVVEDGDHLFLLLPDGKELKTTIIKKTRAQ
jgi:hypothetical protein